MRFAGYAALFDRVDRGGDVVRRGAFVRSLRQNGGKVPLLIEHRGRRVGRIERIAEDEKGLRVIGQLTAEMTPPRGLSFGYRVRRARAGDIRELLELELIEVSLVARPMQPGARVHKLA